METYLRVMEMCIYSLNHVDMENLSQSTSQVLHKLTSKDLATLVNELNPLTSQCHALGLQLGLHYEQLRIIERDYHKCEDQLREIIAVRLNRGPPLTWRDIATALRAASVGANRLASELESKYVHNQPPLAVALQTNAHSAVASLTQTVASTSQRGSFPSGHTLSSVCVTPNNSSVPITHYNSQPPIRKNPYSHLPIIHDPHNHSPSFPPPNLFYLQPQLGQLDNQQQSTYIHNPLQFPPQLPWYNLKPVHYQPPHVLPQHQNYQYLQTTHYTPSHPSLVEPVGGINEETATKRPRIEPVLHPEPHSHSSQYQYHSARKSDLARIIEEVINRHTTELSTLIGDDEVYFTNEFIRLGIITRHSSKEIRTTCGIGNGERGRRLLDTVTTNIGGSRDRFEKFVSVFSSEPAYQELATSMTENFRTGSNCSLSHNVAESCVAHPPIGPFQSSVAAFVNHVKTVYRSKSVERDTTVVKWPPTPSEIYINLAMINRQANSAKCKKYAEVTETMVHDGNVDVILKGAKEPIEFEAIAKNISIPCEEDAPKKKRGSGHNERRLILVEGAPGVGKSTFAWEFCRRWERGEIAQQYQLVLLLRLRDERVSKAKSLQDLIYHPLEGVDKAVCTQLALSHDFNCLIILEGFDELPDSCRNEQSIFIDLISGKLLPVATVLVTSRPWATKVIHQKYENRVSQHIEILGFTSDQITRYIKSTLPLDEVSDLNVYLERHPQIRSGMYIPLNSAIVVTVYQESQTTECALPTTLTELYTALTQVLLHRHMRGHPECETAIKCIDTLALSVPPKVHDSFFKLCKLAYSGIVGTSDQVQLIFRDLPSDFDDLGLMDSVTELYVTQGAVSSYNFLHLTFQEFFAAMHISTMSEEEQLKHFYRHKEGRLKMVLRFLAGLKKLSCFSFIDNHSCQAPSTRHEDDSNSSWLLAGLSCFSNKRRIDNHFFQTPSIEHEGNSSYLMSCDVAVDINHVHWMFEAQSEEITLGHGTVEFYNNDSLLPLDCYALGYCIVHSQCQWVLRIQWGEEEMRMLVAGASTKQETTAKVVGLHLQENEISTECLNTLFTKWKSLLHLHQLSLRLPEQCDSITLPDLSTLRVLDIEVNSETKWGLDTLLSHLSLDSLTVHIYSDSVCDAIGDYIESTSCHLKELFIIAKKPIEFFNEEDMEAITATLASNHSLPLERLELECKCEFTDTAAEDLAQFMTITTTLCDLAIKYCTISVCGVLVLDRVIQQNSITMNLEDLTIEMEGDNDADDLDQLLVEYPDMARRIISTESGDAGVKVVAKALQHSHNLWSLDLPTNSIGDDGAVALAQALNHNSNLFYLNLSDNSISDDGAGALAQALHRTSINELFLPDNSISDEGAVALAQALHHNSTLEWLDLSNNRINDAGAGALAHALHHNSTLKGLELSNNSISDDVVVPMAQALHRNSTLRWLKLSNNSICDAGARALAQALHHNSTLDWLDLSGNDGIGGESTHQLVQVLTVNKSICVTLPRRCEEYATQCAQYQTVKNQFKFC